MNKIDATVLQERVLADVSAILAWAVCLHRDETASADVDEAYLDYFDCCRARKLRPVPRKIWIAVLKLAGFEKRSGRFIGVRLVRI